MISNNNNLQKWYPLPLDELDTIYDLHNASLEKSGMTVIMIPDGKRKHEMKSIRFSWEKFIAYQVSEETFRDDCWVTTPQDAWSFWRGKNSQYLQSFKHQSTLFPDDTLHFLFIGTNLIADVLAVGCPTIEVI